jgi:hypothetical protein
MDVNRGLTDLKKAVSIIEEYRRRRETTAAFAEWFSIDPPFPDGIFGDEKLVKGAYVNGGIMPLVGGELARAAFENGFETYGVDILRRYWDLVGENQATYLWYFPDGAPASVETSTSPEAQPTDGWGSSAMLYALVEGLVGITDDGKGFDRVTLAPRWAAADVEDAEVQLEYPHSGKSIGYHYHAEEQTIRFAVFAEQSMASLHVLLPEGHVATQVTVRNHPTSWKSTCVQSSNYVDIDLDVERQADVLIELAAGVHS